FTSRRRHTRSKRDWSSDVCSSDLETNFDTDLFMPIIEKVEEFAHTKYGKDQACDSAYKIIADHIRTVAFAIGDKAIPSNEGRGYILRRLIRRAVRYAKTLGI